MWTIVVNELLLCQSWGWCSSSLSSILDTPLTEQLYIAAWPIHSSQYIPLLHVQYCSKIVTNRVWHTRIDIKHKKCTVSRDGRIKCILFQATVQGCYNNIHTMYGCILPISLSLLRPFWPNHSYFLWSSLVFICVNVCSELWVSWISRSFGGMVIKPRLLSSVISFGNQYHKAPVRRNYVSAPPPASNS